MLNNRVLKTDPCRNPNGSFVREQEPPQIFKIKALPRQLTTKSCSVLLQSSPSWLFTAVLATPQWQSVLVCCFLLVSQSKIKLTTEVIHMHLILLLINNVIDSHIYSIPHMLKYDVAFKTKHYIFSSLFSIDHYSSISPSYFRFSFPSFGSYLLSRRLYRVI